MQKKRSAEPPIPDPEEVPPELEEEALRRRIAGQLSQLRQPPERLLERMPPASKARRARSDDEQSALKQTARDALHSPPISTPSDDGPFTIEERRRYVAGRRKHLSELESFHESGAPFGSSQLDYPPGHVRTIDGWLAEEGQLSDNRAAGTKTKRQRTKKWQDDLLNNARAARAKDPDMSLDDLAATLAKDKKYFKRNGEPRSARSIRDVLKGLTTKPLQKRRPA